MATSAVGSVTVCLDEQAVAGERLLVMSGSGARFEVLASDTLGAGDSSRDPYGPNGQKVSTGQAATLGTPVPAMQSEARN